MLKQLKRIFIITLAVVTTVSFSFDSMILPFSMVEKAYAGGSDEKTYERVGKEEFFTDIEARSFYEKADWKPVINKRSNIHDSKLYAMVFKTGYTSGAAVQQIFLKYVDKGSANLPDAEKEKHALYRRINPNFISQSTNYRMDSIYQQNIDLEYGYYKVAYEAREAVNMRDGWTQYLHDCAEMLIGLKSRIEQVLKMRAVYENNWEGSYLQIQSTIPNDEKSENNIELGREIFKRDLKFNPSADAITKNLNTYEAKDEKILSLIEDYSAAYASYTDFMDKGQTERNNGNVRESDYYFVQAREQLKAKQDALLGIEKRKKEIVYETTGRKVSNITVSKSFKEYGTVDDAFASDNTTTIVFNFDFDKYELLDVSLIMKEASTGGGRIDNWSLESWDIYEIKNRSDMAFQMYSNISDSSFLQFYGYKLYSYVSNLDGLSVSSASLLQDNDGQDMNFIRFPVYGTGKIETTTGNTMVVQDESGQAVEVTTEGKPTLVIDNDNLPKVEKNSITETLYGSNPEVFPRFCKVQYTQNTKKEKLYVDETEDQYTFELSLTDSAAGGLEELNKWPLEPNLEFFEYLYADIQYYDGTMIDGVPRMKSIKIPVITNAVLKAGSEKGFELSPDYNETSAFLLNTIVTNTNIFKYKFSQQIDEGKILSFAQQGEKLVFDVLLPSCINIVGLNLEYEATADNTKDDQININAVKVYNKSQVESVSYDYPFLSANINLKPGEEPLYSYTAGSFNGITIYVDSEETIELNPSGHADVYPTRTVEDMYLVKVQTSTARSAGTVGDVGLCLKYIDTKGEEQFTTEYNLKESMEDFYGYWIGEIENSQKEADESGLKYGRENAAFRIGGRPGGEFCMIIEAPNVSHFTGFKAEILDDSDDDWQIESMKIVRLTSLGKRTARTIAQSNAEYNGSAFDMDNFKSEVEEINGVYIDRYYNREYDGDVLIGDGEGDPGYKIRVLVQPDSVKEYDFVKNEETETLEHRDYSAYADFMDYNVACTDLKFTKNDRKYTVKVTIPENSTQGVRDDGCGSRNLFYFQLIFQNGESGYVLANSQMTTDGFIAGTTSTFTIYTNSDKGDIVEVNIIPDDLDIESDVLDKLYIEQIEIIRDNPNGIARRFICSDIGWVTRDYHSNDETEIKGQVIGRTKQELVCRYPVSAKSWILKYEFAITTGQTLNTKYGQYDGPLKADITYETANGTTKVEKDFDIAAAMYEYNNKAPKKNSHNVVVVDPERMLRPETTDRFFVNISDAISMKSIKFIAEGSSNNANWTIKNISVSLVRSNSTLWINENDEYQMQYEKEDDPKLVVDEITNANLPCLFTLYGDVKNTKRFDFAKNKIDQVDELGQTVSVATRVPQSQNDEFNVFIYLEKDKVEENGKVHQGAVNPEKSSIEIGTTIYYTGQFNDYKVNENKLKQTEVDGYHVMYALGISAQQFKSLQAVSVNTSQATSASIKANVPVAYAILQHIRGDVVCDTYYVQFGGSDPSILSGKSTSSSVISALALQGEYQTVDISFGNGTMPASLVPMEEDIAVAIQYESFNIDGQSQPYWSPYVFLSDNTMEQDLAVTESIDSGQSKQFKFNAAYLRNITAIKVIPVGGLKLSVDNALVNQYGFGEGGNIELTKSYGLDIQDSKHMVPTTGAKYDTKQDAELTSVLFKFTVEDPMQNISVGTNKPVRLKVNYDSYTDKSKKFTAPKTMEIANITGSGFEPSQTKEVTVMLEDLKEIRNVQLVPDETFKLKSASYEISNGDSKTVLVADSNYTDENKPITINFSNIIVRVNGITYKSDGASVRSNETTDNGNIHLVANSGEKFVLAIDVKNQLPGNDTSGYNLKIEQYGISGKGELESSSSEKNSERVVFTVPNNDTLDYVKYLYTISSKEVPDLKATVELEVAPKTNPIPDTMRDKIKE